MMIPDDFQTAEAAIIAACLGFDHGIEKAQNLITPEHFSNPHFRQTYKVMLDLHGKNGHVDLITVIDKLPEKCNFIDKIIETQLIPAVAAAIPDYAEIVKKEYSKRRLGEIVNNENLSIREQIKQINKIDTETKIGLVNNDRLFTTNGLVQIIEDVMNQKETLSFATGIDKLDEIIGGFQPGTVTAIQALYKTGKTKLLIQIMCNALKSGSGVGFLSLEMSKSRVQRWILSHLCQIDSFFFNNPHHYRWNEQKQDFVARIVDIEKKLTELPLFVSDIRRPTIDQVAGIVAEWARQGVKLVGLDYFERMETGIDWKDEGAITSKLADLANQYDIALVYIDQLNKAAEGSSQDTLWTYSRGSTARNADADLILQMLNQSRRKRSDEASKMARLKIGIMGREVPSGLIVNVMADLSTGHFRGEEKT